MTIKKEGNSQSTSFVIDSILLESGNSGYDLTEILQSIEIEEDIDDLMDGVLVVNNKAGLFEQRDFGGNNNYLTIKMRSTSKHKKEGKQFTRRFNITQFSDVYSQETNMGMTKILFRSEGEYKNTFKRVSKSYKNVGTHAIVSDMLKLIGYDERDLNIETTMYNRDIVIPNITPLETVYFLKKQSVSGESKNKGDSNFYFFESRDGINFVSQSALIGADPVATYSVCYDQDKLEQNIAIRFVLDRGVNVMEQARSGAYGLTVVSHSLMDKSIRHNRMTPDDANQTYKPLSDSRATDVEYNAGNVIMMVSEDQMYQFQNVSPSGNSIAVRELTRSRMHEKRAQMRIGADSDITVGNVINLRVDGSNGNSKSSGKWLVAKVKHLITRDNWFMDLLLVTDGSNNTLVLEPKKEKTDDKKDEKKG
ncbi:hypothetical protein [Aeromonas salmonicida]